MPLFALLQLWILPWKTFSNKIGCWHLVCLSKSRFHYMFEVFSLVLLEELYLQAKFLLCWVDQNTTNEAYHLPTAYAFMELDFHAKFAPSLRPQVKCSNLRSNGNQTRLTAAVNTYVFDMMFYHRVQPEINFNLLTEWQGITLTWLILKPFALFAPFLVVKARIRTESSNSSSSLRWSRKIL